MYCDFDDLDIAWTVLMRRKNFNVDFNRTWQEYKDGFGDLATGDFWLGLEKMHLMTAQRSPGFTLWIILRDHRNIPRISAYGQFSVGSEQDGYALWVDDHHGQDHDYLQYKMNYPFRPYPSMDGKMPNLPKFETRDHMGESQFKNINCASLNRTGYDFGGSGWWFTKTRSTASYNGYGCGRVNLNAQKPKWGKMDIKFVEMRMRPNL